MKTKFYTVPTKEEAINLTWYIIGPQREMALLTGVSEHLERLSTDAMVPGDVLSISYSVNIIIELKKHALSITHKQSKSSVVIQWLSED